jgi:hypothetical protein
MEAKDEHAKKSSSYPKLNLVTSETKNGFRQAATKQFL